MKSNTGIWIGSIVIVLAVIGLGAFAYFAPSLDTAKDKADVSELVTNFGSKLKNVPLSGEGSLAQQAIQENYSPYVTPELLQSWLQKPSSAPGRLTSSPWPDRIEVQNVTPQGAGYIVNGTIDLLTSVEAASSSGATAGTIPVVVQVIKNGGAWQIAAYQEQAAQ